LLVVALFRALESLRTDGRNSRLWEDISLAEVIMTLEDLIDYFAPPGEIGSYIYLCRAFGRSVWFILL